MYWRQYKRRRQGIAKHSELCHSKIKGVPVAVSRWRNHSRQLKNVFWPIRKKTCTNYQVRVKIGFLVKFITGLRAIVCKNRPTSVSDPLKFCPFEVILIILVPKWNLQNILVQKCTVQKLWPLAFWDKGSIFWKKRATQHGKWGQKSIFLAKICFLLIFSER